MEGKGPCFYRIGSVQFGGLWCRTVAQGRTFLPGFLGQAEVDAVLCSSYGPLCGVKDHYNGRTFVHCPYWSTCTIGSHHMCTCLGHVSYTCIIVCVVGEDEKQRCSCRTRALEQKRWRVKRQVGSPHGGPKGSRPSGPTSPTPSQSVLLSDTAIDLSRPQVSHFTKCCSFHLVLLGNKSWTQYLFDVAIISLAVLCRIAFITQLSFLAEGVTVRL